MLFSASCQYFADPLIWIWVQRHFHWFTVKWTLLSFMSFHMSWFLFIIWGEWMLFWMGIGQQLPCASCSQSLVFCHIYIVWWTADCFFNICQVPLDIQDMEMQLVWVWFLLTFLKQFLGFSGGWFKPLKPISFSTSSPLWPD